MGAIFTLLAVGSAAAKPQPEPYTLRAPSPTPSAKAVIDPAPEYAALLIKKHQAYVGWSGDDAQATSVREVGSYTDSAKTTRQITSLRSGVVFRDSNITEQGLIQASGFDGRRFWSANQNGFTTYPIGDVSNRLVPDALLFSEMTGRANAIMADSHVKIGEIETDVVRLIAANGAMLDVYEDPATGAFHRVVLDPGGKYELTLNDIEYRQIDGKRFISAWHFGDSKTRYEYTDITPTAAIPQSELLPPPQTAQWSYGSQPIPIDIGKPIERIIIDVSFNGVRGKFLFDTGASGTAVFDSFARASGAVKFGTETIRGYGGNAKANLFRIKDVTIGDSTLHNVVVSSGLNEQQFGHLHVVGIIGYDLLAQTTADLNFDTKTLTLRAPSADAETVSDDAVIAPIDLSRGIMRMPMQINGKVDVVGALDTGDPTGVNLSPAILRFGLDTFAGHPRLAGGVGGTELELCGALQSMQLGPVTYKPVPACLSPIIAANEMYVGMDFLQHFNYTFDYPHQRLIIRHRAAAAH